MNPPLDSRSDQPSGPWSAPEGPPAPGSEPPPPPPTRTPTPAAVPAFPSSPSSSPYSSGGGGAEGGGSGDSAGGTGGGPWGAPPPAGPPTVQRPTGPPSWPAPSSSSSSSSDDLPPPPPPPPDPLGRDVPPAGRVEPVSRPGPWGWRALVAFLAGGLLVGAGFGVAQLDEGDTRTTPTLIRTSNPPALPPSAQPGVEPVADVARILGPAVVQIETRAGLGSGVIYSPEGFIVTNNHVITGSRQVQVRLADGRRLAGEVLGTDPVVDIAVVKIDPVGDLPVAELALGVPVEVGQLAVAIGSPFELQQTVTSGIVSAVNRPVPNGAGIVAMIQTDAPINPGNSGGALANRNGQVIGINTSIRTETGTNAGIGFAVPIDTAMDTAQRIINGEPLDQAFLGVAGREPPSGETGVLVTEVTPGSGAEAAGVQVGDRITSIEGQPVTNLLGLAALVRTQRPGDAVAIELIREDQPVEIQVTLGTQSAGG